MDFDLEPVEAPREDSGFALEPVKIPPKMKLSDFDLTPVGWKPTSVPNDKPQTDYGSRLLGQATGLSAGHSQEKGLVDLVKETLTTRAGLSRLPIVGGLMEIGDSTQILNAAKAIEAGTADAQQQQVFDDYVSRQIEKQARGTSTAYEIADIIAMIPGFALEFAMTGGSFSAGRAAAKKTMEAAMKKTLGKRMAVTAAARGAAQTAGYVGGVLAQQGTLPTRAIANVIERQAPSVQLQVNQQGDPSGYRMEPGEGLREAIPKGILDDTIELGSERAGGMLGPLAKIVSKPKAVKRLIELLEKTPMSAAARAKLGAAFEKAGIHSPFGESFEERVGDVARDVTGVSDQPSDLTKMVTGRSGQPGQTPGQVRLGSFAELAKQTAKEVTAFAVPGMAGSAYERITRPRTDREVRARAKVLEEGLRLERLDRDSLNHIVSLINHEKSGLRGTPEGERLLRIAAQRERDLGKSGPNLMGANPPEAQPPHPAGPGSTPTPPPTGPGGPSQTVRQQLGVPVQPVIPVPGESAPATPSGATLQPPAPAAPVPPVQPAQPTGQTLAPTNPLSFGQAGATVSRMPAPDPQAQLSALGWNPAQIAAMKPDIAARVIQAGMRPEQMPPASQPPATPPVAPTPAPVPPVATPTAPEQAQATPAPSQSTPAPVAQAQQATPAQPVNQEEQAQPEIQVITEKKPRKPPTIDPGKSLTNAILSLGGINPKRIKKAGTEAEWKALPASLRRRIMRKDSTNSPDDLASQLADLGYMDIQSENDLLNALSTNPRRGIDPGEMSDKEYWKAYEQWMRDKEDEGVSEPSGKYAASGRKAEGREIRTPAGRKYINGEEYFLMPFPELGRGASAWVKAANYPDGKKRTTRGFVEESAPQYGRKLTFPALAATRAKQLYNKGKIYHDQALDLPAGKKRTLLLQRADELRNQAAAILDQSREDPMTAAEYRERVQTLEAERQAIIDKYRSRGGKPWAMGAISEADALRINSLDVALSNLRAKAKSMVRAEAPKGQVVPMKRGDSAVSEPARGPMAGGKPKPVDKSKAKGVKGEHGRRKAIEAALNALVVRDPISAISGASAGFKPGKRSLLGLAIRPFLAKGRRIDVRGEKIKSLEDAVAVGRLFRNPQFETFHYIFVKAGKIVAHESVSSGLPGFSKTRKGKNDAKALWKLRSRIGRIDHDAVYLFHNHPLGDVTTSVEDRQFTVGITRHLPKFAGHIVIDHTEYSIIGSDGIAYEHIYLDNPKPDFDRTPLVDHPGLQERVQDGDAVARWGRKYAHPDGDAVTVLYLSSQWKVHGIEAIPVGDLSDGAKFAEWLKGRGRIYASTRAILYYNDRNGSLPKTHKVADAMDELVMDDVVTDGIVDSQSFGLRSARPFGWTKQGFQFGRSEEDIDRRTVVREKSDPYDSPAFRKWFGESKVVDAEGKPLVVYHGTRSGEFAEFDPAKKGSNTFHKGDEVGFHFTTDNQDASVYAGQYAKPRNAWPEKSRIISAYVSIQNPLVLNSGTVTKEDIARAKSEGRDGIIANAGAYGHKEIVAFSPTQIKSVNNRGSFDSENPNILREQGGLYGQRPMSVESFADANAQAEVDRRAKFVRDSIEQVVSGKGTWAEKRRALGLEGTPLNRYPNIPISAKEIERLVAQELADTIRQTGLTPTGTKKEEPKPRKPQAGSFVWEPAAAYHGSPFKFDKFSTSKIGTGEGAQAYGHGLYFASKREVAEHYKRKLSDRDDSPGTAADWVRRHGSKENAIIAAKEQFQKELEHFKNHPDELAEIERIYPEIIHKIESYKRGHLYEVELAPEEDEYLLWDKPLSEQSEKVRTALGGDAKIDALLNTPARRKAGVKVAQMAPWEDMDSLRGEDFYKSLSEDMRESRSDNGWSSLVVTRDDRRANDKAASEYLHSLGIRGIKYLDGSSRKKGEGDYNYVIFSDDDVEIKNVYEKNRPYNGSFDPENPNILREKGRGYGSDSQEFDEWFAGSKAVDDNGSPVKVYRGAPESRDADFDAERGSYFSSKRDVAGGYTSRRGIWVSRPTGEVSESYLSLQNPLIIDALGKRNDNIPVPWQEWKPKVFGNLPAGAVNINEAYAKALEMGHDGLIVRNVVDTVDAESRTVSDVYVASSPSQIRPADPSLVREKGRGHGEDDDYMGTHRPPGPDGGAPLHDLTGGGSIYPDDVYGPNGLRYYGTGEDRADMESMSVIQFAHNHPNKTVTIYRAVPKEESNAEAIFRLEKQKREYLRRGKMPNDSPLSDGDKWYEWATMEIERLKAEGDSPAANIETINYGDWVTVSRSYAKQHGESTLEGKYRILSKKVKAKEIFTNGDSLNEFGYWPEDVGKVSELSRSYNEDDPTPKSTGPINTQSDFERQYAELVKKLEADRQYRRWGKLRDYIPLPGDAAPKNPNRRPTLSWRSPNNVLQRMGGKYAEIANIITEASRARKAAKLGKHFFGAQHFDDIANEIVKEAKIKRGSQEDEMVRDLLDRDFTGLTPDALRADKSYQGDKEAAIKAADRLRKEVFDPIIEHIRGDAELSAIIGTKGYIRGYFPHYFDTMRTKYGEKNAVQMMRLLLPKRFTSRFLEERQSKDWASGVSIFDVLPAYIQSTAKTIHDIPAYDKARRLLDEIPEGDGIEKGYIEWYLNNYMGIKANPHGVTEYTEDSWQMKLSRKVAQLYYDNLIGLNPKTWIINLTQPLTNTVPEIGIKYVRIGITQLYTNKKARKKFQDSGLLLDYPGMESGIMSEGAWRRMMHKGMSAAEWSNRGITYLAGLAKAKDMGLIGPAAEMYALDLVDKTQFSYGPEAQSEYISKRLPHNRVFQTFKQKQIEFTRNLIADAWTESRSGEGTTTARKKLGTYLFLNGFIPVALRGFKISVLGMALSNLGFEIWDIIPGMTRTASLGVRFGRWFYSVLEGKVGLKDIPSDIIDGLYDAAFPGANGINQVTRWTGVADKKVKPSQLWK